MANSYIGDLIEEQNPDLDSLTEIEELTDPLDPTSRAISLRDLMSLVAKSTNGFQDINDLATASTPISGSGSTIYTVTNDGFGSFSTLALPTGLTSLWVPGTNSFDLSQLSVGDTVGVRFDAVVTTTTANQEVRVYLESNQSPGTPFPTEFINAQFKSAGDHNLNRYSKIYLGSEDVKNNPHQFKFVSDASFDLKVNGFVLFVDRRTI